MSQTCDPRAHAAHDRSSIGDVFRFSFIANILASVLGAIAVLWRRSSNRRQIRELMDMDDRMLQDLGITRNDVRVALYADPTRDPSVELSLLRNRAMAETRSLHGS